MKKYSHKIILIAILILAIFLRFFNLSSNPPSLYWEEAALGYDAYSILKTGKDFHGNSWPLIAFESFGDYKPSVYFYAAVPSVAVFGLTPFAVRFPSALFGSLTVLLIYFLTLKLLKSRPTALISAFLLAISPWHLQLSRAGFEANLGLFLTTLGAWLFFKGLTKKTYLFLAMIAWALSLYTYHANRVFIPLLGLALGLVYFKKLMRNKWSSMLAVGLFLLILTPLVIRLNDPGIKKRFQQTSAFATLEPIIKSNQLIQADGGGLAARLLHHRFWQYTNIFFDHYFDHFKDDFLFLSGDTNSRHSTQLVGSLYLIQLPLLLWGIVLAFKEKYRQFLPLIIWLVIAPIPAALTKATPHALRALPMIIPLTILSAYGLTRLRRLIVFLACLFLFFELSRYLFIYHLNYPKTYSHRWQYGYQQMVEYVASRQADYEQIYITRGLGRPSIYYWFYTQTEPKKVQAINHQVKKDQGEYLEFNQLTFGSPPSQIPDNSLLILSSTDPLPETAVFLKEIYDLSGQLVFRFYET